MSVSVILFLPLFMGGFLSGSEQPIAALSITPYVYVDSSQWYKHIENNRHDFPTYTISFEDKPLLAQCLQDSFKKYGMSVTQAVSFALLQKCTQYGSKKFQNELGVSKRESMFVASLCGLQFYKWINVLQLETGEYIQRHYEQRQPSIFFRELKEDILRNCLEQKFYQDIAHQARQVFDPKKAVQIVKLTEQFDKALMSLPYDSIYSEKMVLLFDKYLHDLNYSVGDSVKSKL